ncbi:MAG: ribosomal protein S18-alanine N-acetyltransferase [Gammaproteobacteria bacterium]|nr:ribosomal protein S18-alanine N-acetyltransferase [Gammaproteobacteria bacterium]
MNVTFKSILESDLDSILAIENESHIHPWPRGVFRDCLRVSYVCDMLVDSQSGEGSAAETIIVYGIMSVAAGEAHIFNVCVSADFRRQGFGEKMLSHLLAVAKNKNAEAAFLEVRPSNLTAISLYEKLGFEIVGRRKDYYPAPSGREDAVIMTMKLDC